MRSVLIRNIKSLVGLHDASVKVLKGEEMKSLPSVENAFLLIEDGLIKAFGKNEEAPERADEVIEASGRFVLPCYCDSHTHLVFAAYRENEFVDRLNGLSYEEIAKRGGGILNSAAKLNAASEEELFDAAWQRLEELRNNGTGAVEIKSGYGLSYEGELKMLRVIRKLKEKSPLSIKSTFLGAHAYPQEFKLNHKSYLDLLINQLLPKIADEGLADFIDVFCERGYFDVDEASQILDAGAKYGLRPKVHVNQFNILDGVEMCTKRGALSVDHLELLNENDILALKRTWSSGKTEKGTMPVALLACSFFLNLPYTPARQIIDAGLPLALASDFNPGSSPTGNMNFVISLACIKMKMLPEEAVNAATLNGAYAMDLDAGSIALGKKASLFVTKPMPSLAYLPYSFGSSPVERVLN